MEFFRLVIKFCIFILLVIVAIMIFFTIEEYSDIYRYSDIGLVMVKDDFYQSVGLRRSETKMQSLKQSLGYKGALTYAYLDRDGNGYLSAAEIEPVIHMITHDRSHQVNNLPPSCNGRKCLKVSVAVGRIYLENATFVNESGEFPQVVPNPCSNLTDNSCRTEIKKFLDEVKPVSDSGRLLSHRHFLAFLPRSRDLSVGQPFYIVDHLPQVDGFFRHLLDVRRLRSHSYVELHERSLSVILGHFYNGHVSLYPSGHPRFSMGIIRAKTSEYVDVQVRLLSEFSGFEDFLVVPSAIIGNVVFRLSDFKVMDFKLQQESDIVRFHNFLPGGHIVGTGSLPTLEMKAISRDADASRISWTEAISPRDARLKLFEEMHGMKPLDFLLLDDLSRRLRGESAAAGKRPILIVLTMANLFDQTCHWGCPELVRAMRTGKVALKLRFEFSLVKMRHSDVEDWVQRKNLTTTEKDLALRIKEEAVSPHSVIAVSEDGKRVIGSVKASEVRLAPDPLPPDSDDDDEEKSAVDRTVPLAHVLEEEARKANNKFASLLLNLLNKAMEQVHDV